MSTSQPALSAGNFLRLVWPKQGFYCIAHPFKPKDSNKTVYVHKIFGTISEAITYVHEAKHTADTFFAVLTLREEKVWDADKIDYKTGQPGAWATRLQSNMLAAKALFFDLDVGAEDGKYPSQREAMQGLIRFLIETKLPMPTLVSSGGGVHVYWHFDEELPAHEWRDDAYHMRQLAGAIGLKVDPTRTIDTSSVLRVPETFNLKDKNNPREVKVLQEGVVTPIAALRRTVSDALIAHGVTPGAAPVKTETPAHPLGEQTFNDFGPPPTMKELVAACAQSSEIIRSQGEPSHPHYGKLEQTAWYRGMVSLFRYVEDGDNWVRKITAKFPRATSDVEAKLVQAKAFPPPRCQTMRDFMPWGDKPCQGCKFLNDPSVPNPIAATRKTTLAPPPVVNLLTPPQAPQAAVTPVMSALAIPNPPKPWERLKAGGIGLTRKDKDGNEQQVTIYAHDLYPLKRLTNGDSASAVEQQVWRVTLPRVGARDFVIDADALYDGRKFAAVIANNGIYPNKADLPALQDYMVAYISQLQRDLDADTQTSTLGWNDEFQSFVMPDKILTPTGVRPAALTEGAKRATQFITKRGTLQGQTALMGFYRDPRYIPNQFAILCSLGSILMYMTGHHGVVVNMSGDSGASKSTTLYTCASLWGHAKMWPINGTNRGATANARSQRTATNGSLPTCVDEITHMPAKDAIDLAMSASQPGHRLRLGTDGNEKANGVDGYKAALMLTTANSSLHSLLSSDNAAGTAGSMRVFEMKFTPQRVHTKGEADDYLRALEENFGHIGEVFAQWVVQNRALVEKRVQDVMRKFDADASIQSSERFWSAPATVAIVAGEIANALHLLPFDVDAIREWLVKVQVPYMRGVVKEEYRDPLAVLTDYIAEKSGNIIVIEKTGSIGGNTAGSVGSITDYAQVRPHGALLGHYDMGAGVMYLLKQGFKDHCARVGGSASRILEELSQPRLLPDQTPRRIVVERAIRRTLGAGTDLAKGQTWCFAVDMTHPEIAGVMPTVVSTGTATSAPAGKLSVVK